MDDAPCDGYAVGVAPASAFDELAFYRWWVASHGPAMRSQNFFEARKLWALAAEGVLSVALRARADGSVDGCFVQAPGIVDHGTDVYDLCQRLTQQLLARYGIDMDPQHLYDNLTDAGRSRGSLGRSECN